MAETESVTFEVIAASDPVTAPGLLRRTVTPDASMQRGRRIG